MDINLVDLVWEAQPCRPCHSIIPHPTELAGRTVSQKLSSVRASMVEEPGVSVLVLNALDQVSYLTNLRGSDIESNPVSFSYAVVTLETAYLYVQLLDDMDNHASCVHELETHLEPSGVELRPYSQFIS